MIPQDVAEVEEIFVNSMPRPYCIHFSASSNSLSFSWLNDILKQGSNVLFIDQNVYKIALSHLSLREIAPVFLFDAIEDHKNINSALDLCNFLQNNGVNRGSMLYVVGGGITQDIGAFAGAMYRRGIPWTLIPTTLLSQTDSCLGSKSALNFSGTKNLLGLFSAPRNIIIDTNFLNTLSDNELLSGLGETLRLTITGGEESFSVLEDTIDGAMSHSTDDLEYLIKISLSVKKAVVDADEYELDLRRSMNYGHSIGHAIEALSDYRIPHGTAIAMGILIVNAISANRGLLPKEQEKRIAIIARKIISEKQWHILAGLDYNKLLFLLANDKKTIGRTLKLIVLEYIGKIIFIDLELNQDGIDEIINAIKQIIL